MTQFDRHVYSTPSDGRAASSTVDEPEFSCRVSSRGDWIVVALTGELDMSHLTDARRTLIDLHLPVRGRLAIDLRALSFMDSTGVRVLLQAMADAERRLAAFAVIRGTDAVQRVLEVIGLADQLPIVDDLNALQ